MTRVYWWSPRKSLRGAVETMQVSGRAWLNLASYGAASLRNFGDELSPIVLEYIMGRKVHWAPLNRSQIVAVGSIVNLYAAGGGQGLIFGSGVREPSDPLLRSIDRRRIVGVRGPLSAQVLGGPTVPVIGDPGLLVSEIFTGRAHRSGIVLIPHFNSFSDASTLIVMARAKAMGWRVVPATRPVSEVIESIKRADLVLTNSLHGIVCSDAFGTPVQMIDFAQTRLVEPSFKYSDYAQSVGVFSESIAIGDCFNRPTLSQAISSARDRADIVRPKVDNLRQRIASEGARCL